jgi:hypothetical protein
MLAGLTLLLTGGPAIVLVTIIGWVTLSLFVDRRIPVKALPV